jgi:hypothetical protein
VLAIPSSHRHSTANAFVVKSVNPSDIATVLRQLAGGAVFHAPGASASRHAGPREKPRAPT